MIVIPGYGRQEYQPASPGSVDWGNTISSGLIFALDRGVNCFNGREFTKTGTKLGLTKKGIAVGIGSTVGVGTTDVINTGVTASPSAGLSLIIAFTCNGTGGGGFGRMLQKGASGNGETQIYITGTNNRLIFQRYNSSATRLFEGYITDSSTTINDGKLHVLEVYQDGSVSAPISFVDGVLQTDHATAGAGGGTGTTSDPYLIGNRYDGTRAWDGYILSAFGFSRVLSDHEKISLRVNPWQLFQAEDSTTIIVGGTGSANLAPGLLTNTQTFYAPTVGRGAVTLTPSLVTNSQTFYGPTVSSSYGLTPSLVTNSQTFYGPTVSAGAVTLQPSLVTNTQTFYSPTVSSNEQQLLPSLVVNEQTFYASTVSVGQVTLQPSLVTNQQMFFGPVVLFPGAASNDAASGGGGGTQKKRKKLAVLEVDGKEYVIPADDIQSFLNSLVKPDKKKAKKQEIKKPVPVVAPEVRIVEVAPEIERVVVQKVDRTNELLLAAWNRAIERELEEEEDLIWLLVA